MAAAGVLRKLSDPWWAASSASTSRRTSPSAAPQTWSRKAGRSADAQSSAALNTTFTRSHWSGGRSFAGPLIGPSALAQLTLEPRPGHGPLPLHGRRRDPQRLRRLLDAEPREVAQLHHPRLLRI